MMRLFPVSLRQTAEIVSGSTGADRPWNLTCDRIKQICKVFIIFCVKPVLVLKKN